MSQHDNDAIREVSAHRLSTSDAAEQAVPETVAVVLEAPVTIDIERIESYTLLCTPDDNLARATGFLLSEGIVDGLDDVVSVEACKDDPAHHSPSFRGPHQSVRSRYQRIVWARPSSNEPG